MESLILKNNFFVRLNKLQIPVCFLVPSQFGQMFQLQKGRKKSMVQAINPFKHSRTLKMSLCSMINIFLFSISVHNSGLIYMHTQTPIPYFFVYFLKSKNFHCSILVSSSVWLFYQIYFKVLKLNVCFLKCFLSMSGTSWLLSSCSSEEGHFSIWPGSTWS